MAQQRLHYSDVRPKALQVSERRACRAAEQPRSTQRLEPRIKSDEERLREAVIALALEYGRYGYRQITGTGNFLSASARQCQKDLLT